MTHGTTRIIKPTATFDGIRFFHFPPDNWRAETWRNGMFFVGWGSDIPSAKQDMIDNMQLLALVK